MIADRSLFEQAPAEGEKRHPLADRMRPETLEDMVGQDHVLGPKGVLRLAIENDRVPSMILWGPPGVGKTTLARIVARSTSAPFLSFSAVLSGIKEVKAIMKEAKTFFLTSGKPTILFVDEIHRFNKAQQDAFLPYVESGEIVLIGATTENPSFEVISALLSRLKVFVLYPLGEDQIEELLRRALTDEQNGLGGLHLVLPDESIKRLCVFCNGDARTALNALELAAQYTLRNTPRGERTITPEILEQSLQQKGFLYDKQGEEHFNLISALHKTLRNSDPDAALYWLARMLEAGEDPLYIARRLVRFATEDVGLADPRALRLALDSKEAVHFLGQPEGELALAQAVLYLALAPKSNSVYRAYGRVRETMANTPNEPVPFQLRNAPTRLMREHRYGEGYEYAHELDAKMSAMEGLPRRLAARRFYYPTEEGLEKQFKERLNYITESKARLRRNEER